MVSVSEEWKPGISYKIIKILSKTEEKKSGQQVIQIMSQPGWRIYDHDPPIATACQSTLVNQDGCYIETTSWSASLLRKAMVLNMMKLG